MPVTAMLALIISLILPQRLADWTHLDIPEAHTSRVLSSCGTSEQLKAVIIIGL